MKRTYKKWAIALVAVMMLSATNIQAQSPTGPTTSRTANRGINAKALFGITSFPLSGNRQAAANNTASAEAASTTNGTNFPVIGSGTAGRLAKLTGFNGSNYILSDSIIFEDKFAKVGIGTDTPTSKLTVQGMIETTLGGLKFPDGTVQTTAALSGISAVTHDATLSGAGTAASPLGIANDAVGTAQLADQAVTTNKLAAQAVGTAQLIDNGVTAAKIASGQVVKSFNGLKDNVTLVAGSNVTITPSGNTLTIAASGASSSGTVFHDTSLKGDGVNTALGVNVPQRRGSRPSNDCCSRARPESEPQQNRCVMFFADSPLSGDSNREPV